MASTDRDRRQQVWERYVLMGDPRELVISTISDMYDVDEATVVDDLETMAEWLPTLDIRRSVSGVSAVAELRRNRQELQQLAQIARGDSELIQERKIREEINDSLELELRFNESSSVTTEVSDDDLELESILDG